MLEEYRIILEDGDNNRQFWSNAANTNWIQTLEFF